MKKNDKLWMYAFMKTRIHDDMELNSLYYSNNWIDIYESNDGRLVCLSLNDNEYAKAFDSKSTSHLSHIYDYGSFECKETGEEVYYIIFEKFYGDPSVISDFLDVYNHCWFGEYFSKCSPKNTNYNYNDIEDIFRKQEIETIQKVRDIVKQCKGKNTELFLKMYDDLCQSFLELFSIIPNARGITLSKGNIGFSSDGNLKLLVII